MRRVLVVGSPGAGKTTFARRLALKLGLPLVHLDAHYWQPGWRKSEREPWRSRVAALVAAPEWIMDGDYGSTYDIRMPPADNLIWLDYPRRVCLWRALRRFGTYHGRSRPDMAEGCPERLDTAFVRFLWNYPRRGRIRLVEGIERFGGHLRIVRLANDREADDFLSVARKG